jgi:hypothetical protein
MTLEQAMALRTPNGKTVGHLTANELEELADEADQVAQ